MSQRFGNTSQDPDFLLVYGLVTLPKRYELHRDIVVTSIAGIGVVSMIANAILLLVIVRDPFKQFRTITAILLAFNSAANICTSMILVLNKLLGRLLPPQFTVYSDSCAANLYLIGNLLHTFNIYGTIVTPVRFKLFEPKARKILIPILTLTWVTITCVYVIPPYTLPKGKIALYFKIIFTSLLVQIVLLSVIFTVCYTKILRTLHARKIQLKSTFQINSSTLQGLKIQKQNSKIAKTLLFYVLSFVISLVAGDIMLMLFLHCSSCDPSILQLGALYSVLTMYLPFVIHPFLWLLRFKSYRRAMTKVLCCCKL